jgi:hypothetical protein
VTEWVKKTITDKDGTRTVMVPKPDPNAKRRPGRGTLGVIPAAEPKTHNPGLRVPGPAIRRGRAVPVGKTASRLRLALGERSLQCIASWQTHNPDGSIEVDWGHSRVVFHKRLNGQEFVAGYPFREIYREVEVKGGTPRAFRRCIDRDLEDARWAEQGPLSTEGDE